MKDVTHYSSHLWPVRGNCRPWWKTFCNTATLGLLLVVTVGFASGIFCRPVCAQETDQPSVAELESKYKASVDKLREQLKKLRRTRALYVFSDSEASHDHKDAWDELATQSEAQFFEIRENAYALFLAKEKPGEDLTTVVRNLSIGSIASGDLGVGHRITQRLVDLNPEDESLAEELIRVEIFNNKFDGAIAFRSENAAKIAKYNKKEQAIFRHLNTLKTNFDRELKLREKDKTADLPRVEMKIKGKGTVVLELFEDEAPETVANFISLTEAGFYDGIIYHHVTNGFLAHGGCFGRDRHQPTGYTIYDECKKPERRHHFRGSIATWTNSDQPNSCGSEFSIFRMPAPYFAGLNHTVFGRVIKGMEIIDGIQNTHKIDEEEGNEEPIPDVVPDTIESMKVIRKRDHPYEPNHVKPDKPKTDKPKTDKPKTDKPDPVK